MAAPKAINSEELEERRANALRLRLAGLSYRRIATELKISVPVAHSDVRSLIKRTMKEADADAAELVAMEVERLDVALFAISNNVKQGHLGAIDRWLRIAERRAHLLGLDAPKRTDITTDGKPIASGRPDYSRLTPEELAAHEAILAKLAGAGA